MARVRDGLRLLTRAAPWAPLLLVCAMLCAPLLLVEVPPLLDYPNHLARLFVAASPGDPLLAKMYAPHWAILPNLAVDLLAPPLFLLFPVHVVGRILVGLGLLLPVLGCFAYHRAVFPRAVSGGSGWWPLGAGLVAYNAALLMGFLNFVIALGLALLLAAIWIESRGRRPAGTLAIAAAGALLLFVCHLMGLVLFAVLVIAHEAEQAWREMQQGRNGRPAARLLAIGAVMAVPAALFLAAPFQQAEGTTAWLSLPQKLVQAMFPVMNYSFPLDLVTAVLLSGLVLLLLVTRWGVVPLHCAAALLVLGLLWAVAPYGWKGTWALDARFAVMVGFMVFAAIDPARMPRRAAQAAAALLGGLFVLRMALLAFAWHGHAGVLAELRQVIAAVPAGATVDVTTVTPAEAPAYWRRSPGARLLWDGSALDAHMAALLPIERRAFYPFLFADPAQQPMVMRPEYRALADSADGIRPHRDVAASTCGFEFLLLLDAGGDSDLANYGGGRFELVRANDTAALFKVRPCRG